MAKAMEVKVPDIGEFKNIPVIEVLVQVGDTVEAEDSLVTLESDKATLDVPSPVAGVVREIRLKVGDKVSEGALVLMLDASDVVAAPAVPQAQSAPVAAAPRPAPRAAPVASAQPSPHPQSLPRGGREAPSAPDGADVRMASGFGQSHASPSVRRFARELGVDLSRVQGSGTKGRVLTADVQAYVKSELARPRGEGGGGLGFNLPPLQPVDFAKFGPVTTQALSRIKKLSGGFLHRNWVSIPHITQHEEADITALEAFRKEQADAAKKSGIKFTMLGFLVKAAVVALKQFPEFNASLSADGESLVLKGYFHIGVAVDTPNGLVVPVIRDADRKGLLDIAQELGEVGARMRSGKIAPADLQGGCFSISSLGGIGGTFFTPIINAPEVAILGVGKAVMRPVWNGKEFAPRLMLPLSLSYDHRVIDGALGARFIAHLAIVLSDIRQLVL